MPNWCQTDGGNSGACSIYNQNTGYLIHEPFEVYGGGAYDPPVTLPNNAPTDLVVCSDGITRQLMDCPSVNTSVNVPINALVIDPQASTDLQTVIPNSPVNSKSIAWVDWIEEHEVIGGAVVTAVVGIGLYLLIGKK